MTLQFEEECSHSFTFQKEAGWITRADLQHVLERLGETQPRTQGSEITELLSAQGQNQSGVMTSAPSGNTAPRLSPANTAEPLNVPEDTAVQYAYSTIN